MHPILEEFCDKWVWPTMPGAPGAEFRLRLTREQCLKGWEISLDRMLGEIEQELASNDEDWKKDRALRGYAAEGVHMSIKQMSGQLLSVDIADQERYIDLQRMRARQIWDECKHSKLHADVLLGKGWIKQRARADGHRRGERAAVAGLFRHVDDVSAHPPIGPRGAELLPGGQCLHRHHGLSRPRSTTRWCATSISPSATKS